MKSHLILLRPPDWHSGVYNVLARQGRIAEVEREIDEEFFRLFGIIRRIGKLLKPSCLKGLSLVSQMKNLTKMKNRTT